MHQIGKVQKQGIWLPHELTGRDIERRKTICKLLLQRQKKNISPSNRKSGFTTTIRNDKKHGYV